MDRFVDISVLKSVATSLYGTLIVPVRKSDNSLRICGYYKDTIKS